MKEFFITMPGRFEKSFTGKKIYLHLAAIVLTVAVLMSGFDWYWYIHTSGTAFEHLFQPALDLGAILPVFLPLGLIYIGILCRSTETRMTGWALAQAAVLGFVVSCIYKAFTGRIEPPQGSFLPKQLLVDVSHGFNFGFWEHGIFWGWPSSHTAVAFAMAVAFCMMYRKNKALCAIAIFYAFYVGIGVSMSIHWFSEFVAGALIGSAVGISVGSYFHQFNNR